MFGELKVQLRNESQFVELSEVCSGEQTFAQLRTGFTTVVSVDTDDCDYVPYNGYFCGHCLMTLSLTINETLKWPSSLPILMQESFWW